MDVFDRLTACVGFQWDAGNSEKSWLRHQVSRIEAEEVFFRDPLVAAEDREHSTDEERFFALGRTSTRRPLFVVFTLRGALIRVISAREMTRKEREAYGIQE